MSFPTMWAVRKVGTNEWLRADNKIIPAFVEDGGPEGPRLYRSLGKAERTVAFMRSDVPLEPVPLMVRIDGYRLSRMSQKENQDD